MNTIIEQIKFYQIIPVVVITEARNAKALAEALCKGGLPCAEVTFRTKEAAEAIRNMSDAYPDMLIGAGTVLTIEQVEQAIDAGAKFIVSPGCNPQVVSYCIERGITIIPGVITPSEIEQAISLGVQTVKFFPAEAAGGIQMIKSMSAPYGTMTFIPTGGITMQNIKTYLDFPKVLACGGSFMVPESLIKEGKYDEITRITREAVELVGKVGGK